MKKLISKLALIAAVAALAIASSASDSMARGHKKMAAPACAPAWSVKTNACANGICSMLRCQPDGKWYPSVVMCWQPWCPK
jgi:hypothetical protein